MCGEEGKGRGVVGRAPQPLWVSARAGTACALPAEIFPLGEETSLLGLAGCGLRGSCSLLMLSCPLRLPLFLAGLGGRLFGRRAGGWRRRGRGCLGLGQRLSSKRQGHDTGYEDGCSSIRVSVIINMIEGHRVYVTPPAGASPAGWERGSSPGGTPETASYRPARCNSAAIPLDFRCWP